MNSRAWPSPGLSPKALKSWITSAWIAPAIPTRTLCPPISRGAGGLAPISSGPTGASAVVFFTGSEIAGLIVAEAAAALGFTRPASRCCIRFRSSSTICLSAWISSCMVLFEISAPWAGVIKPANITDITNTHRKILTFIYAAPSSVICRFPFGFRPVLLITGHEILPCLIRST